MTDHVLEQIIKNTTHALFIHMPDQRFLREVNINLKLLLLPDWVPGGRRFPDDPQYIFLFQLQCIFPTREQIVG
ncbi:hypothetical protein D1872_344660 [compost metagenome]